MNQGKIDLHIHTTISDGTDAPAALLARMREAGFVAFSVTDHDAVAGCLEIESALVEGDPTFINGVEFSCEDEMGKYHVLGYGYDPRAAAVVSLVEQGHAYRMGKVKQRLDFLAETYGFTFSEEERASLYALSNPGKPHIANLMIKHGYASSIGEAIKNYLNKFKGKEKRIRPEDAVRAIEAAGGIPVIAHPAFGSGDERIFGEALEERMRHLTEIGIRGAEVYYSGFSSEIRDSLLALAERYDLYVTAGSDYHGINKTVPLGETGLDPSAPMPDRLVRFLADVRKTR